MGWIESASKDDGYIVEQATYLRNYQKAFVDEDFKAKFDMNDATAVDAAVEDDDEVVRWIPKYTETRRWEGLTKSAARTLQQEILADDDFGPSKRSWNRSGAHTVTADYVQYYPDGYFPWKRVEDLPTWTE